MFRSIAGAQVAIVAKEGYVTETRTAPWPTCTPAPGTTLPCQAPTRISMAVTLESLGQAVDMTGDYVATLAADGACPDLPSEARVRTFTAAMVPNGPTRTRYAGTIHAPSLLEPSTFEAGVTGDFVALRLAFFPSDPGLVDQIAPNTYVLAGGAASATVAPGASFIAATFDGFIEYCRLKDPSASPASSCGPGSSALAEPTLSQPVNFTSCRSSNHRLTFTRR